MATAHRISLLGTGLIGDFYSRALGRFQDRTELAVVYSRTADRARQFAAERGAPRWTTDLREAVEDPEVDIVVIGLPNDLHLEAATLAAAAGKAVLCTKPLARTAAEAHAILTAVEAAGVFGGYLEDLAYTPKTLRAVEAVARGAIGDVTWVRSREAHPGPHSAWFWDERQAGGGAIIDLGCHCIEVIRSFMGKGNRPVETLCWADTLVHPIAAEDNAIGLIRFESGAVGQFEVSWSFRGGLDLRDEVAGTEGTVWLDHFLRTGFEIFSSGGSAAYVSEKSESAAGWLFPVGDELSELGYLDMFSDMFSAIEERGEPQETLYDGYLVNAVMDACLRSARSRQWEPIEADWRGGETPTITRQFREVEQGLVIKEEVLPDGRSKLIVRDPATGEFQDVLVDP